MDRKTLTYGSRIKDLYQTPVGHDALARVLLQLGFPERVITNPAVANLKLRTVAGLAGKISKQYFRAICFCSNNDFPAKPTVI